MSQINVDTLASQTGSLVSMASGHFNNFGIMQVGSFGPISGTGNQLETTSTSYADVPNHTITITPKVATSKIFVIFSIHTWGTDCPGSLKIIENSSGSYADLFETQSISSGTAGGAQHSLIGLIDHNTTSAFTIKLQGKSSANSGSNRIRITWYDAESSGFAFEIGNI